MPPIFSKMHYIMYVISMLRILHIVSRKDIMSSCCGIYFLEISKNVFD